MSRALRGAWSRRGALGTLVLMTVVVVGGTVTVLQFAEAAGTSRWLTAPLLLIGAVAVPSLGTELAVARREEIGLARLRGIHGLRLWAFLLLEPFVSLVLGLGLGLAAGAAATVLTTRTWLDAAAPALGRPGVLAALGVAAVGFGIVALSAGAALREPLAAQVASRRRPGRATTLAVFLGVLVIFGAGVAAYRSSQNAGEPDVLVLLGPALVGLALGQVAIWVVRLAARGLTPATERRGVGAFLAARRLARADDLVSPIRLVVAAGIVGSLALSGALAVDTWTAEQAAVEVPGTRTIDATSLGALGAAELTATVDPGAEHLLAAAIVPNQDRLAERRAYVDAPRWASVVGDLYDGTPARAASAAVPDLATGTAPLQVTGDRLSVRVSGIEVPRERVLRIPGEPATPYGGGRVILTVDYLTADNTSGQASVRLEAREGAPTARTVRLRECAQGCTVTGLGVSRASTPVVDRRALTVLLDDLAVGGDDLLAEPWTVDRSSVDAAASSQVSEGYELPAVLSVNRPDGLQVALLPTGTTLRLVTDQGAERVPVLVAGEEATAAPQALDLGGDDRPTTVVGEAGSLPLLGSIGTLADIRTSAAGSGPTVPAAEVQVVADAGTPASVLDQVEQATGTRWRTYEQVRTSLGTAAGGAQAVAYALMALACALVALLALGAGVARHLRSYRRDVAALRIVGVSMGTARRAGRTELAGLTALVVVGVVGGGWLAVRLLLGGLPLLSVPVGGIAVDTSPHPWPLLVPAALAAAAVVVVGGRARAVRATTTRPSQLREEEGR